MRHRFLTLAAIAMFAVACDDKPKADPTPPKATAKASSVTTATTAGGGPSALAVASSSAAASPVEVAPSGKMAHCPNSVTAATTEVKDVPNGVELTVVAPGEVGTGEVRARTKALLESAKAHSGDKHTGGGGGGGTSGRARCPVVLRNTTLAAADVAGGTRITVTTSDAKELDWLRRETRDRLAEMTQGADGAGAHRMTHCPSTVDGASTKVTTIKDGVILAVTGKDPKVVAEIRQRAKHALIVATHDAGPPEHNGEGGHHGEYGKCPIVFTGTTVEEKDLPDGTQITVKAKSASDVTMVQDTTKKRVDRLTVPDGAGSASPPGSTAAAPSASAKH